MFQGFKKSYPIWMHLKVEVKLPLSALCKLLHKIQRLYSVYLLLQIDITITIAAEIEIE